MLRAAWLVFGAVDSSKPEPAVREGTKVLVMQRRVAASKKSWRTRKLMALSRGTDGEDKKGI